MAAPINIYLENATHYVEDLDELSSQISRFVFERQLLAALVASDLQIEYKLSMINEILKGARFDAFWNGVKNRLGLNDSQITPYEPDARLCLPPSTIEDAIGSLPAPELPTIIESTETHSTPIAPSEADQAFESYVPRTEADSHDEHTETSEYYTESITWFPSVEQDIQYVERPRKRSRRAVDYTEEIARIHERQEKEDGAYRPNSGLRHPGVKKAKTNAKGKRGGKRIKGVVSKKANPADIIERSLARMDAEKHRVKENAAG